MIKYSIIHFVRALLCLGLSFTFGEYFCIDSRRRRKESGTLFANPICFLEATEILRT